MLFEHAPKKAAPSGPFVQQSQTDQSMEGEEQSLTSMLADSITWRQQHQKVTISQKGPFR